MKIGATSLTDLQAVVAEPGQRAPIGNPATGVRGTATDRVQVSAAGIELNAGGNDFDSVKVEAIRQAIREGRFQVNAGAIADRLIADAAALLGPRGA